MPTYETTIKFFTTEEVTPDLFAEKVALACMKHGALREGEALLPMDGTYLLKHGGWKHIQPATATSLVQVPNIRKLHRMSEEANED